MNALEAKMAKLANQLTTVDLMKQCKEMSAANNSDVLLVLMNELENRIDPLTFPETAFCDFVSSL